MPNLNNFDFKVGKLILKIPCMHCVEAGERLTTDTVWRLEIDFIGGEIAKEKDARFICHCPYCGNPIAIQLLGRFNDKNGLHLEKGQTYYNVFYKDKFYTFSSEGKTIPFAGGNYKINEKGELELL